MADSKFEEEEKGGAVSPSNNIMQGIADMVDEVTMPPNVSEQMD